MLLDNTQECANPKAKQSKLAGLQMHLKMMKENDPECSWEKLKTYAPYRQRIPFDDTRLEMLRDWFEEALA